MYLCNLARPTTGRSRIAVVRIRARRATLAGEFGSRVRLGTSADGDLWSLEIFKCLPQVLRGYRVHAVSNKPYISCRCQKA